jgi:hypothetical protein
MESVFSFLACEVGIVDDIVVHSSTQAMCRNIRPLFNFEPPATEEEIRAAALQFVRKVSGYTRPPQANQAAFDNAVEAVTLAARDLVYGMITVAPPKNRDTEAAKARARNAVRFAK